MKVLSSVVESKKDIVKASVTPHVCNDIKGKSIVIDGFVIFEKEEEKENGEKEKIVAIAIKDKATGEFYTSISVTIRNSLEAIAEAYGEEEIKNGVEVIVKASKTKSNREFLYLDVE